MKPAPPPETIAEDNSEAMADFNALTPAQQAEFRAAVEEGMADARAGRTIPLEAVKRWLLSWGSENELPPPEWP
jgi:predicted transcriptional regulator